MRQVRKRSLSDAVLEELKRMIRNEDICVGDKLPNQNVLAAQLGVSRTSLREAISKLAFLGAIDQKPGVGTILTSKFLVLNADTIAPPLMSYASAARELNRARKIVEVGAASLAAEYATDSQIQTCGKLIDGMEKALKDNDAEKYIELDMDFHLRVIQASNNRFVIYSYKGMQGFIEQYIKECLNLIPKMQSKSMRCHINIYEAIRNRDPEEAALQMKNHIEDISNNYKRYCEVKKQT